jgi:hypothetical protein
MKWIASEESKSVQKMVVRKLLPDSHVLEIESDDQPSHTKGCFASIQRKGLA